MTDARSPDRLWDRVEERLVRHFSDHLDIIERDLAIMRQEIQDALTKLSTDVTAYQAGHQTQVDSDTAEVVAAIQAIDSSLQNLAAAVPVGEPTTPQQVPVDANQDLSDLTGHGETDAPVDASIGGDVPPATAEETPTA